MSGGFRVVSTLTSPIPFKIIAHATTRQAKCTNTQPILFINIKEEDLDSSRKKRKGEELDMKLALVPPTPPQALTPIPLANIFNSSNIAWSNRSASFVEEMRNYELHYSPALNDNRPIDLSILNFGGLNGSF
jgi:hypothetical protein